MKKPQTEKTGAASLPATRRKQLKHLLKNRSLRWYQTHLLTAVWFVPLLLWHYLSLSYTNWAFSGTAEASLQELPNYFLTVYGTGILLWILAFVGLAGGMYVLRKMAWADHVRVWKDFWKGVCQSGGQFAAVGLVFSLAQAGLAFAFYWLSFYQQVAGSQFLLILGQISALVTTGLLGAITVFTCCVVDLYRVTLPQAFLAGFRLFFGSLFSNVTVVLLSVAPMLIPLLWGSFLGRVVGYFVILAGGLGFAMLLWVLAGLSCCDRQINQKDYPDNYLRGLAGGRQAAVFRPDIPAAVAKAEEELEEGFEILP